MKKGYDLIVQKYGLQAQTIYNSFDGVAKWTFLGMLIALTMLWMPLLILMI